MGNKSWICDGCGKQLDRLSISSPMLSDELWEKVLDFFHLTENRPGPQLAATAPKMICSDCMEKALGRKLQLEDLKQVPFNLYFQLHYFCKIPYDVMVTIQRIVIRYAKVSPKYSDHRFQSEVGFLDGLLMPFIHPESNGYIESLLPMLSDQQLKNELNRREKNNTL